MAAILHDDLPTLDDKLDWTKDLSALADALVNCKLPHVFGVHGDWGAGKTSFMRQLQHWMGTDIPRDTGTVGDGAADSSSATERKTRQKTVATVWFDAWRYQNEPVPAVALLQEIRRQLPLSKAIRKSANKLAEVGFRSVIDSVAKLISQQALPIDPSNIQRIGEKWEADHFASPLPTDAIRDQLREAIEQLLPKDGGRVVIFIDDLDRCNPKSAFRLLESLKIYFHVPRCAFVLGMNEQTLTEAIAAELPAAKDTPTNLTHLRAAHYLEKICTTIFRLNPPSDPAANLAKWIAVSEQQQAMLFTLGKLRCLPPNPRRLKALANQWHRFAEKVPLNLDAGEEEKNAWAVRILVVAYIYQFHRDLWERWRHEPAFWSEVKLWCCGESVALPADWIGALKLPERKLPGEGAGESWSSAFPDPNAIELFWIAPLIRTYQEILLEGDFLPFIQGNAS